MLYDPKWEQQTEVNPHSVAGIIAWLETQPADKEYAWYDTRACLACRYLEALGYKAPWGSFKYTGAFGNSDNYFEIAGQKPWTYGAALGRARKLLTE